MILKIYKSTFILTLVKYQMLALNSCSGTSYPPIYPIATSSFYNCRRHLC